MKDNSNSKKGKIKVNGRLKNDFGTRKEQIFT